MKFVNKTDSSSFGPASFGIGDFPWVKFVNKTASIRFGSASVGIDDFQVRSSLLNRFQAMVRR